MARIQSTDHLFATATVMGRRVFSYSGNGIDSMSDLIEMLRTAPGVPAGLVSITIRNGSQGWSQQDQIYLCR